MVAGVVRCRRAAYNAAYRFGSLPLGTALLCVGMPPMFASPTLTSHRRSTTGRSRRACRPTSATMWTWRRLRTTSRTARCCCAAAVVAAAAAAAAPPCMGACYGNSGMSVMPLAGLCAAASDDVVWPAHWLTPSLPLPSPARRPRRWLGVSRHAAAACSTCLPP